MPAAPLARRGPPRTWPRTCPDRPARPRVAAAHLPGPPGTAAAQASDAHSAQPCTIARPDRQRCQCGDPSTRRSSGMCIYGLHNHVPGQVVRAPCVDLRAPCVDLRAPSAELRAARTGRSASANQRSGTMTTRHPSRHRPGGQRPAATSTSRNRSWGRAWAVIPSRPTSVSAATSALTIASSVASMAASKSRSMTMSPTARTS